MADLTQQIRERLGEAPAAFLGVPDHTTPEEVEAWQKAWDDMLAGQPKVRILAASARFEPPIDPMREAILAVLELHEAFTITGGEFEGRKVCRSCGDTTDEHLAVDDPCPTKVAIAEQLGTEVDRG